MINLQLQRLNDLTAEQKAKIQNRESIDVSEIQSELIAPMALEFKNSSHEAFFKYAEQFDIIPENIVLDADELAKTFESYKKDNPKIVESFESAFANIKSFHEQQKPINLGMRYIRQYSRS